MRQISGSEYPNIRKVIWTHKGEWEHPGNAISKVLTDITPYTDYVKAISELFDDEAIEEIDIECPIYTTENFLVKFI